MIYPGIDFLVQDPPEADPEVRAEFRSLIWEVKGVNGEV